MEMISIEKKKYDALERALKELQKIKIENKMFDQFDKMLERKRGVI